MSFDPASGQLTIRAAMHDGVVAEAMAPNGCLTVTLGSQRHDSDPASAFFDPALAGAGATTVATIREGGDGGHSTLMLGAQALPGRLTIQAEGPVTVRGDVSAGGSLAITAPAITVRGALHGAAVGLTAAGTVRVDAGATIQAAAGGSVHIAGTEVDNDGHIHADGPSGGQVRLSAGTVRNAGRIDANGLLGDGGTVWIGYTKSYTDTAQAVVAANGGQAGRGGSLTIVGASSSWLSNRSIPESVAARGSDAVDAGALQATGAQGGAITVTGEKVTVAPTARVDVAGAAGGGSVRIGGDFHGQGETPTATRTYVAPGATIQADALEQGPGGNVAIWSNDQTWYYGRISARGGSTAGNGGRLEVSGKQDLQYNGQADAAADHGQNGTLLLDPYDINVVDNGETNDLNDVNNFDRPNLHGDPDPHNPGGTDISVSAINAATGDVSLFANHDINVNTAIHVTNAGTNLNLFAMHDLNIYSPITVSTANMLLSADYSGICNGGAIRIAPGADLTIAYTTGNKGIFLSADQYDLQAALSPGGGSVTLTRATSANIYLNSTITNDGTNTLYVSQNVLASITTSTLFVGGDGRYGDINLIADLDVSGVGMGAYNLNFKTVGNITTFDGTVYHNIALGNKSIDFENNATGTGDISTGSITGTGQDPAIFRSNGGVYFNGDFAVPGSDLNVTSSNFYAAGQLNVGRDLINLEPAATVVLMTFGGPGGTGSYEVTDNELANMTTSTVHIGIDFQLGLDAVLGNNIVGLPYLLFAGGDTLYEMGYTVGHNVILTFNNIVP